MKSISLCRKRKLPKEKGKNLENERVTGKIYKINIKFILIYLKLNKIVCKIFDFK